MGEKAKRRFINRSALETLCPTKKPRSSEKSEKLAAGLASAPQSFFDDEQQPLAAETERAAVASECALARPHAASVNPNALWQEGGADALALHGWKRLESRGHPGRFYFLHAASSRTVIEATHQACAPDLPHGWEQRESRHCPGSFYYVHLETGEVQTVKPPLPAPVRFTMTSKGAAAAKK